MKKNINNSIESYLKGNYEEFKNYERIKFLLTNLKEIIDLDKKYKLLDLGCSKGEIIYLIKENFKNIEFTGIDKSQALIDKAKNETFIQSERFILDDILSFNLNEKFDIILMSGVLSIFDDYEKFLLNAIQHMKKNSYGIIFSAFNKEDIDVIIRYRNNFIKSKEWESGWNLFSLKQITKFLENFSDDIEIIPFKLNKKIKKKSNPVTSYSIELKDDSKMLLTGGNIVRDFYLIKFKIK